MTRTKASVTAAMTTALLLAAAGCGGDDSPKVTSEGAGGGAAKPASDITVSYISGMKGLPFYVSLNCGAQARAKELGITYDYNGPADFDATQQIPIVNAVGAKKPDALIVTPTDNNALIPPLKAVQARGVKIVAVDGTVPDKSIAVSEVLSDNVGGGKLGAKALNDLTGGKGSVVVVSTKPGISSTDERGEGFKAAMKDYPGLKFLGIQYNQGSDRTAQSIVTGLLASNPDLSGIFLAGNVGSEGAAAALRAANLGGRVKVVQYDASPSQVDQLKAGILDALIAQDPYQEGIDAVNQAVNAAQGKPVQKLVMTDLHIITKKTIEDGSGVKYQYKTAC